jgi:hypothetical protein
MSENDLRFFTVCTTNQLSHAASLRESIGRHYPGKPFTAWVVDVGTIPPEVGTIDVRWIGEVLSEFELVTLTNQLSFEKLSDRMKPRLFEQSFVDGAEMAVYLDPDIYLFAPLTDVCDEIEQGATGVFVPRSLELLPVEEVTANDRVLFEEGMFDLGAITLKKSPEVASFLSWWWGWLQADRRRKLDTQDYLDTHWVYLGLLFQKGFKMVRNPAYSISYWHLQNQELTRKSENDWRIDGLPLVFFHFERFQPANRSLSSKRNARVSLDEKGPIGELFSFYASRLHQYGFEQAQKVAPKPITFSDGAKFDVVAMEVLLDAFEQGRHFQTIRGNGPGSFREFLSHVSAGQSHTEYAKKLFKIRADLVVPLGKAPASELYQWIRVSGVPELGLDPRLFLPVQLEKDPRDVSYVGYLKSDMGLAQAARGHIAALRKVGIEPRLVDVSHHIASSSSESSLSGVVSRDLADTKVTIVEVNAEALPEIMKSLDFGQNAPSTYRVGVWAWETLDFPDKWSDRFQYLDEIWCGSDFIARSIAQKSPIPVVSMPYCVECPDVEPDKKAFDLSEEEFVFLFTFDFWSFAERKNPFGTIAAFRQAFSVDEPVRLLIKSMNGSRCLEEFESIKQAAAGLKVTFIDGALDTLERFRLLASCDAYVSLHRAEGFGYGMAEAMAYGKPVVATGWSGNMEFTSPWNSFLVDFSLARLGEDSGVFSKETLWPMPDLDDAARQMRLVWQNKELRDKVGQRAKREIRENFGPEAVGRLMKQRLEIIDRHLGHERVEPSEKPNRHNLNHQNFVGLPKSKTLLAKGIGLVRREGFSGLVKRALRRR